MTERDRAVAEELRGRLAAAGGAHVRRILAFGSRVRGDAEPDSDLDVAVLLDEPSEELEGRLRDAAYEVMWDRDFAPVISLKFFEETRFDALARKGYSFFRSVVEEGVVL